MSKVVKKSKAVICISLFLLTAGCATHIKTDCNKYPPHPHNNIDPKKPKNIFVFFDGTANSPEFETNVWKLWEAVRDDGADQLLGIYCPGVGSLDDKPLTGKVLGRGMEERILAGYGFITRNYVPERKDNIYIFGFSRGAHQARALSGLISYAGIPKYNDLKNINDEELGKRTNEIIELLKKESDEDYIRRWKCWKPNQKPFLGSYLFN